MCTGADLDSLAQKDSKCHERINVVWLEYVNIKLNFVWHKPQGSNGGKFRDIFSYIGDKCQVIYLHHVKADVNQRREEAKVDK